jgi:hypothetical protein
MADRPVTQRQHDDEQRQQVVGGARTVTATIELVLDTNIPNSKLEEWAGSIVGAMRDDTGGVRKVNSVHVSDTNS